MDSVKTALTPDNDAKLTPLSGTLASTSTGHLQPSQLPIIPFLQGLTPSECLFSVTTRIDIRSLEIKTDREFYLFVKVRAERKWVSYKMSPQKWVAETRLYNERLEKKTKEEGGQFVSKTPRALINKLSEMEDKVLMRLATDDFKCK